MPPQRSRKAVQSHALTNYHLICIGVGHWTIDAGTMANHFVELLKFARENVHVLNEGDGPTAQQILDKIAWMKTSGRVGPKDALVFYYSGHGFLHENAFMFGTQPNPLPGKSICKAIAHLGLKLVMFLIDACNSEGFAVDQMFSALTKDNGKIAILAASAVNQTAPGDSTFSHLFAEACRHITDRKRKLKENVEMCLHQTNVQFAMNELREKKFTHAPNAVFNGVPFKFGPLDEVRFI